jgi:hypothetical protein
MIIEYTSDCEIDRNGRIKKIKKGKRLIVTNEKGREEIKAKRAKDITQKQEEFLKAIFEKQKKVEEDGNN